MHRLPLMVAETEAGKSVDMTVIRKGKPIDLQVKIGELESNEEAENQESDEDQEETRPAVNAEKVDDLGISVAALTDSLRSRYEVEKDVNGVIVTSVSSDGPAADQDVEVGDVISEASQEDVKTPKDLIEQTKQAKKEGKPLLLLINRKDDLRFVAITFPKKK